MRFARTGQDPFIAVGAGQERDGIAVVAVPAGVPDRTRRRREVELSSLSLAGACTATPISRAKPPPRSTRGSSLGAVNTAEDAASQVAGCVPWRSGLHPSWGADVLAQRPRCTPTWRAQRPPAPEPASSTIAATRRADIPNRRATTALATPS